MYRRACFLLATIFVLLGSHAFAWPIVNGSVEQKALFVRGVENNVYEVPALYTTVKGTVLAICEAREEGRDTGNVDIVMRRSEDGGKTWSSIQVIWNEGRNVCGNSCILQDSQTGTIWLMMTWNHRDEGENQIIVGTDKYGRRPHMCYSNDDGKTWSKPVDVSKTCRDPNWGWYATGPGVGIQLKYGKHKGRLLFPADHSDLKYTTNTQPKEWAKHGEPLGSHVIYSDDHGKTWQYSEPVFPGCNENQVVELVDGTLMMNIRSYGKNTGYRSIATSTDGGETWTKARREEQLIGPTCHAAFLRYSTVEDGGKNRLLFSNPPNQGWQKRFDLTVRVSYDEGKTWPVARQIFDGYSGYSSLTVLPNGDIGCLYNAGDDPVRNWNEAAIYFARFPLKWLEGGKK